MPKKLTTQTFIEKSKLIKDNAKNYNYNFVEYKNYSTSVDIFCNNGHGIFNQKPQYHLNGVGCPKCNGGISDTLEYFIEKANKKHKNLYSYFNSIYISSTELLKITCNLHGDFLQIPASHLTGRGCPECFGTKKSSTDEFIEKSKLIQDYAIKYDYSVSNYINAKTKINIKCKVHGIFSTTPNNHLRFHGCPKCTNNYSKPEVQWLDSLNIKEENRQIKLPKIKQFKVDGYEPETNTVYEFYGDFWHGNPNNKEYLQDNLNKRNKKTFKELYEKTIERENKIKDAGYNLVIMWESDFISKNNVI